MTDDELINYCDAHSKTQLALFHTEQIHRMLFLAGEPLDKYGPLRENDFYHLHDSMKVLVRQARAIRAQKQAIKKGTEHLITGGYRAWATYKHHHIEVTGPDEEVAESMVSAALEVILDG